MQPPIQWVSEATQPPIQWVPESTQPPTQRVSEATQLPIQWVPDVYGVSFGKHLRLNRVQIKGSLRTFPMSKGTRV